MRHQVQSVFRIQMRRWVAHVATQAPGRFWLNVLGVMQLLIVINQR